MFWSENNHQFINLKDMPKSELKDIVFCDLKDMPFFGLKDIKLNLIWNSKSKHARSRHMSFKLKFDEYGFCRVSLGEA